MRKLQLSRRRADAAPTASARTGKAHRTSDRWTRPAFSGNLSLAMGKQGYRYLRRRDGLPPSWIMGHLPPEQGCPTVTEIFQRLEASGLPVARLALANRPTIPDARWEVELDLRRDDAQPVLATRLWVVPSEQLGEFHLNLAQLTEQEHERAAQSRWSLGISCTLAQQPLRDFHRQLLALWSAAPDAVVYYDVTACRAHGRAWVEDLVQTQVPPPPHSLYALHAVHPEKGEGPLWLHTHGLTRCGLPELEICGVPPDSADACGNLLSTVAAMFLELGPPPPGEHFSPGQGIELIWLPWQQGLRRIPRRQPGGPADRNEYHRGPSALLFAPRKSLWGQTLKSPAIYATLLAQDPLLYVSRLETERMTLLAQERYDRFSALFRALGGHPDWTFLIKLGLPVDNSEATDQREHLWFQVHHLLDGRCEVTLLNEPYAIASLQEGHRGEFELAQMSDWQIICPLGQFTPDSVVHLQRALDQASAQLTQEAG